MGYCKKLYITFVRVILHTFNVTFFVAFHPAAVRDSSDKYLKNNYYQQVSFIVVTEKLKKNHNKTENSTFYTF